MLSDGLSSWRKVVQDGGLKLKLRHAVSQVQARAIACSFRYAHVAR